MPCNYFTTSNCSKTYCVEKEIVISKPIGSLTEIQSRASIEVPFRVFQFRAPVISRLGVKRNLLECYECRELCFARTLICTTYNVPSHLRNTTNYLRK